MQPGADEIDYRETADITKVHGAVKREHREPEAGTIPVPLWLFGVVIFVTFVGAYYLGQYNGGFSGSVFNEREGLPAGAETTAAAGAGEAAPVVVETLAQQGKKVFTANCLACHQATGEGLPGVYPPLAKSEWVNGPSKRVAMIVLKGLQGPLEVEGKTFNGAMPAWGGNLNDKKLAAVLSYVRSEWGNKAPEITPEQMAAVRKEISARVEPWTQPELKDITAEIEVPAAPAK